LIINRRVLLKYHQHRDFKKRKLTMR